MDGVDFEIGAFGEAVVFLEHFRDLSDVRQSAKVMYPLGEVLLLSLLAVLAGAEMFFSVRRQHLWSRFEVVLGWMAPNGIAMCQIEIVVRLKLGRPPVGQITRIGVDTSKNVFQLHGVNAEEKPVVRKKFTACR